jgi:putative redox protein
MDMNVSFPGGVVVQAHFKGHTVTTDQPAPVGADTAMSPFDLFFASLATCMGFYALRFCQERSIPTEGLGVSLSTERDPQTKRVAMVRVNVTAPSGFPDKYREALLRAVDQCAVKKHVINPPEFAIELQ